MRAKSRRTKLEVQESIFKSLPKDEVMNQRKLRCQKWAKS